MKLQKLKSAIMTLSSVRNVTSLTLPVRSIDPYFL
jgi:hypothetical protein